jgi:hypothetical protein
MRFCVIFSVLILIIPLQNSKPVISSSSTFVSNPILIEISIQDRESFTDTFETRENEFIRFNLTTDSDENSEVRLRVKDATDSWVFDSESQSFDELFSPDPVLNNVGTWQFWVENPGRFPGGDFIDVTIEIYQNADEEEYLTDHLPQTDQTSTDVTMTTTEEKTESKSRGLPNELIDTITFPYSLDLGRHGTVNTTLRLMTGIQPLEIFGINGRSPIDITVSVGKYISSANVELDNLSFPFSVFNKGTVVPFYTPFMNSSITLFTIPPLKIVLQLNISYFVEFNITKGNGELNQTIVEFMEPGAKNISLEFTGKPKSGDVVEINVTWKSVIKAQIVLLGAIEPVGGVLHDESPQVLVGKNTAFEVEIDKKKSVTGFEVYIFLVIPLIILLRKRKKLN